jgi:hypothetical protein
VGYCTLALQCNITVEQVTNKNGSEKVKIKILRASKFLIKNNERRKIPKTKSERGTYHQKKIRSNRVNRKI